MSDPRRPGKDHKGRKDKDTPKTPTTKAPAPTPSGQPSSQRTSRTAATQSQEEHAQVTGMHGTPSQPSSYYGGLYRPVPATPTHPPAGSYAYNYRPDLARPTHPPVGSYAYDYRPGLASPTHPPVEKRGAGPAAQSEKKSGSSSMTDSKAQSFAGLGIGSPPTSNYRYWSTTAEPGDVGDQEDFIATEEAGVFASGRTTTVPTPIVPSRRGESQNTSTPATPRTSDAGVLAWRTTLPDRAQSGRAQSRPAEQQTPTKASRPPVPPLLPPNSEAQRRGQQQHTTTPTLSSPIRVKGVLKTKPADERVAGQSPSKASPSVYALQPPPPMPQMIPVTATLRSIPSGRAAEKRPVERYQSPTEQTPAGYVRQRPTLTGSRSQPPTAHASAAPRYPESDKKAGKRPVGRHEPPTESSFQHYGSQSQTPTMRSEGRSGSSSPKKPPREVDLSAQDTPERAEFRRKMQIIREQAGITEEGPHIDTNYAETYARAPRAADVARKKAEDAAAKKQAEEDEAFYAKVYKAEENIQQAREDRAERDRKRKDGKDRKKSGA
jgi:hypothetical protein